MGQPAARVTDMHVCPMFDGPKPHVGGPIIPPCMVTVITVGLPQARVTDMATCAGPPDMIVKGSATVYVGKLPAARMGDMTVHGGSIVIGAPTVLIGDSGAGGGGGGMAMAGMNKQGAPKSSHSIDSRVRPWPPVVEGAGADVDRQVDTLQAAAGSGAPFCEQCMKNR